MEFLAPCFQPGPTLTVVDTWQLRQKNKALSLILILCFLNKKITFVQQKESKITFHLTGMEMIARLYPTQISVECKTQMERLDRWFLPATLAKPTALPKLTPTFHFYLWDLIFVFMLSPGNYAEYTFVLTGQKEYIQWWKIVSKHWRPLWFLLSYTIWNCHFWERFLARLLGFPHGSKGPGTQTGSGAARNPNQHLHGLLTPEAEA